MKIWIVTIGEPIPHKENELRLHRSGLLSNYISENTNSEVVLWTSLFNHFTKKFEFKNEREFTVNKNLKIKCIKGLGYSKNISLHRIIDHYLIYKKIRSRIKNEVKPDIIVCSFPTISLSYLMVQYGKNNNIPVLVDYRDTWPEVFIEVFPNILKPIFKILLSPIFLRTKYIFTNSTGIVSLNQNFLSLAIKKIKRAQNKFDAFFPLGYHKLDLNEKQISETVNYWKSKKIDIEDSKYINLVYLGTFGNSIYLDEIILAFKSINKDNLRLILCGSGDNEKHLKKMANNHPNIFFPGYVKSKNIKTLLVNSHIGLCPYVNSEMYLSSLPGKVIEYLSEGLFLLSSLKEGFVGNMINKNNLGSNYEIYQKQSFIHALKGIIKLIESEKHDRQKIIKFFQENYSNEIVFKNYYNHIMKTINTYV